MKKTAIWMLRHLLIPVGFIWSTGVIGGIMNIDTSKNTDKYSTFDSAELSTLEITPDNFLTYKDSILTQREKEIDETGLYEPYLYFRDFKQFKMFESKYFDSLNKIPEKRHLIFNVNVECLVRLRDENWRHTNGEKMALGGQLSKIMSISDARAHWFPKQTAYEKERKDNFSWQEFWQVVLGWVLSIYLKGMLVSVILFLLWRVKFKQDLEDATWRYEGVCRMQKFAPISFIYSLLIWPVILITDIRNRGKNFLAHAEVLSRRRDMLDVFSKEEKVLIELGRKMSIKEFSHFLSERGLVRRHSFALALVFVPLIFVKSYGATVLPDSKEKVVIKVEVVHQSHVVDHDVGWNMNMVDTCLDEGLNIILIDVGIMISFFTQKFETLKGFKRSIDGVPRVSRFFA